MSVAHDQAAPTQDPGDELMSWFTAMRRDDPVHEDENGAWHLFRHEDVTRALADTATFSSNTRRLLPTSNDEMDVLAEGNIINMDPPEHRNLRGLIAAVFTPRVVDALIPRIEKIANDLLDEADGGGAFELVDTLSYPLPVIVIAELLGVPISDRPLFRKWADALLNSTQDKPSTSLRKEQLQERMDAVAEPMRALNEYMQAQVDERRKHPTDDLIGRLAAAEVDGERLTDNQITGFAVILLLAGHITTTATLGNALYCLDRNPDQMAALRAEPDLIPNAIEEVIRYRSPFPRLGRATTRDVEIGGRTIPADRIVLPWIAAANRDPEKFDDPERFDVRRTTTGHVAFGHGIHFCIGSRLARVEARVALRVLLNRYGSIAVDPSSPTGFQNPYTMIGITRLPLLVS